MKKSIHVGAGPVALVILGFVCLGASAQGQASFQVQIANPGETPQVITDVLEVQIDDIVIDYQAVAVPSPDDPPDLAAAAKAGYRLYSPGQAHWGNARLTLAPGPDTDFLYQWYIDTTKGKTDRRSISVIFHNDAGEEAGRYNFFECWPVRYKPPTLSNGVVSDGGTLEVGIGAIELLPGIEGTPKTPGNVSLGFPNANGTVDFDGNWDTWSGGELAFLSSFLYAGTKFRTDIPGHLRFEPLVLQGHMTGSRKDMLQWITDTIAGKPWQPAISLRESPTLVNLPPPRGKPANNRVFTFYDCFPTRYVFPQFNARSSGHAGEKLEIVFETQDGKKG